MTPADIKAINAVLDACATDPDDPDDWVADVAGATVEWRKQGSPRVEVPDREALKWAANVLDDIAKTAAMVTDGTVEVVSDEPREVDLVEHVSRGARDSFTEVSAFLRSLAEGE